MPNTGLAGTLAGAALLSLLAAPGLLAAAEVIEITQTGCQFLESENGVDHGFEPKSADDCNAINTEGGADRLAAAPALELAPGTYTFRVTNTDVPYELGFWIRDKDYDWKNPLHKLTKTSVSGGGMTQGVTKEYEVELAPGEYLYSCPLNPTPNYRLVVKG